MVNKFLLEGVVGKHSAHNRFRKAYADRLHDHLPEEAQVFRDDLYPEPSVSLASGRTVGNAMACTLSYAFNASSWFFGDEGVKQRYLKMINYACGRCLHAEIGREKAKRKVSNGTITERKGFYRS